MLEDVRKLLGQYKKWKPGIATRNIIYTYWTRERRRSFGEENPEKTIYLIRSIADQSPLYIGPRHNLLANYFYVVSHLMYAQEKGWSAVVDQEHYPVYNLIPGGLDGVQNPWEYFWTQPDGITLEETFHSKHVVLSKRNWYGQWDMGYEVAHYTDQEMLQRYHEITQKIPLNAETTAVIEEKYRSVFPEKGKVIGVSFRYAGHGVNSKHPGQGHPVQPELKELILIVKELVEKWQGDYVFLASDQEAAVEQFRIEFGSQLLTLERRRLNDADQHAEGPGRMYEGDMIYQTSLDYLTEMELLAKCHGLIGSVSSGLRYAIVRNGGKYEHIDILDYGLLADPRKRGRDSR